jgi:hypothetical protein
MILDLENIGPKNSKELFQSFETAPFTQNLLICKGYCLSAKPYCSLHLYPLKQIYVSPINWQTARNPFCWSTLVWVTRFLKLAVSINYIQDFV